MSLYALMTGLGTPTALITLLYDTNSGGGSGGGGGTTVRHKAWALGLFAGGALAQVTYQFPVGEERPIQPVLLTAEDTSGKLTYAFRDTLGNPIPISAGATVTFRMKLEGADSAEIDADGAVEYGPLGIVSFTFSEDTPVPAAGRYNAIFQVAGLTMPLGRTIPITVQEALT